MVIIGVLVLVAAVIVGVAAYATNSGSTDALQNFSFLGYDIEGTTGSLFLWGMAVGAVALLGLAMVLAGARGSARRTRVARRELKQSRREAKAASRASNQLVAEQGRMAPQQPVQQPIMNPGQPRPL